MIFLTQISWGTITKLRCPICSQNNLRFRNLASIVPTTHLLKITAHLLLTYYSISYQYLYCSKQITLHQSITEGEFLFTPIVTCLRSKSCTSVVKLSITKNWDIKKINCFPRFLKARDLFATFSVARKSRRTITFYRKNNNQ